MKLQPFTFQKTVVYWGQDEEDAISQLNFALEEGDVDVSCAEEWDVVKNASYLQSTFECDNCGSQMNEEENEIGQGLCPICIDTIQ